MDQENQPQSQQTPQQPPSPKPTATVFRTGMLLIQRAVGRTGKDGITLYLGDRPIGRIVLTDIQPSSRRATLGFTFHPGIRIVRDDMQEAPHVR